MFRYTQNFDVQINVQILKLNRRRISRVNSEDWRSQELKKKKIECEWPIKVHSLSTLMADKVLCLVVACRFPVGQKQSDQIFELK